MRRVMLANWSPWQQSDKNNKKQKQRPYLAVVSKAEPILPDTQIYKAK